MNDSAAEYHIEKQSRIARDNDVRFEHDPYMSSWLSECRALSDDELMHECDRLREEYRKIYLSGWSWTSAVTIKQFGGLIGIGLCVATLSGVQNNSYLSVFLFLAGAALIYICFQADKEHRAAKEACLEKQRIIELVRLERRG